MVTLFKKAVRSVWGNKRAYASCIVLIAISVFAFTAMQGASSALGQGTKVYYHNNRLADVFAKVQSIDRAGAEELANVDGIDEVLARTTYEARVLMPDNTKIIYLRLISYDPSYEGTPLNAFLLREGGGEESNQLQALVGESFLDTHGLAVGDTLTMVIEGKEISFVIGGGVISPEYVYAIRNQNELFPDKETFGIAYVSQEDLNRVIGRENEYNDVSFSLERGYVFDDVKKGLEDALESYGLMELTAQKDQISVNMLDSEIQQINSMSTVVPALFSIMAAIVLFLMLKRVIEQERTQIGTLKAFGYKNREILLHYVFYGVFTGGMGGILGILAGHLSMGALIDMYSEYFTLPHVSTAVPLDLALMGFFIAVASGAVGAYGGAKSAVTLRPADAMRPPAPPPIRSDIIQQLPFLKKILTSRGNMALRNIMRAKIRAAFIVVGMMFSFGMLAAIGSIQDMIDVIIMNKFSKVQVFNARFIMERPSDAVKMEEEAGNIPGVSMAEAILEIPAEIRVEGRKEGTMLTGLQTNDGLYRLYDDEEKIIKPLLPGGLVLTWYIADELRVSPGDYVFLKTPYNEDEIQVVVTQIVNQNMTQNSYMHIESLRTMLNLPGIATSVLIRTDDMEALKAFATDSKNVAKTEDIRRTVENFQTMMGSFESMLGLMVFLSASIAFAIIYNTSNISLSEKKREYATLRVLGLHVKEVGEILSFEYWTLFLLGVATGVPFTKFLKILINNMVQAQMDSISMPTTTPFSAYAMAFLGCMGAVMLSNLSAKQNIKKFDMVEVLKERE